MSEEIGKIIHLAFTSYIYPINALSILAHKIMVLVTYTSIIETISIQLLTGASKIVNLVVSVSKCALPTSTVFPYNQQNKINLWYTNMKISGHQYSS